MGQRAHLGDVHVVDAVPGVHRQPKILRAHTTKSEPLKLLGPLRRVVGVGVGPRVQLDERRAHRRTQLDLPLLRVDEQTHLDPGRRERLYAGSDRREIAHDIQPALGGHLLAPLGHDAHKLRLQFQRKCRHFWRARHFEIQPRRDALPEPPHIALLDVSPILAQMDGDTVGSRPLGEQRKGNRIRLDRPAGCRPRITVAGLTNGCTVVDIHAEVDHGTANCANFPNTGNQ